MAYIQFKQGTVEETIPDFRITRSKDGSNGVATFTFDQPQALAPDFGEITGMYMIDDEGMLQTQEVKGRFVDGKAVGLVVTYTMKSSDAFDRFVRFLTRYTEANGIELSKA